MQPERQTNELLASALELADLGMSVIPLWWPIGSTCACPKGDQCSSAAKHPLTMNGLKDATLDANVIKTWWAKWPSANVGLCTGTEIDVIDVDGAIAEYNQLTRDNGIPEHVATVVTGRGEGGIHVYCSPGGNKQSHHASMVCRTDRSQSVGGYVWPRQPACQRALTPT